MLTLVLLPGGVRRGVARDLQGEQHLAASLGHAGALQLPVVGAQEEEGVEARVEAGGGRPEIHAAAPQDQGQQGTAEGGPQRGPRHGHGPSAGEGG